MTNNITNVQMLLNIDGIEINTPDKDGDTPLSHASVFGNPDVVKLLLNKVGNPFFFRISKDTPEQYIKSEGDRR